MKIRRPRRGTGLEKRIAKETGARRTNNSGAVSDNGDLKSSRFVFECKEKSILSPAIWRKLKKQAQDLCLTPVVVQEYDDETLATLSWEDFKALADALYDLEDYLGLAGTQEDSP